VQPALKQKISYEPGRHSLLDFTGLGSFGEVGTIEAALASAAAASGATLLSTHAHGFPAGGGYTAVALLAESHITVHTWPEHDYVAIDAFMCGALDIDAVERSLRSYFLPRHVARKIINRFETVETERS
jgi:S-adenosylmethionine decarboxylase